MSKAESREFVSLNIAVLTVSDTRSEVTDKSGSLLAERATQAGHSVVERNIVGDDIYEIRAIVSRWIVDPNVNVVLSTGGTGVTGHDGTPEAMLPLLEKEIKGFGELFRAVSFEEIGTSSLQSRSLAGVANGTYIFCLPGSTNACATG
ncbi:MAG: molybdenum cofactor synthesis domain-containing protein, partial [Gammaproteobacteria bacterium]